MARTLHGLIEESALWHEEGDAIRSGDARISYRQLLDNARKAAAGLVQLGLRPGDRVAILSKNDPAHFELLFAASMTGTVLVSLNWRLSAAELGPIIEQSAARAIFLGGEFGEALLAAGLPEAVAHRFALDGDNDRGIPAYPTWRDAVSPAGPFGEGDGDEVVLQLYTSGTTGEPKGVMLSQANLLELWDPKAYPLPPWERLSTGEQSLMAMPLFHVAGIAASLSVLCSGSGGILRIMRDFDPQFVGALLEEDAVVRMCVVPAIIRALLDALPPGPCRAPSLRYIIYGASPMPEAVFEAARGKFGCGFVEVYGLTETAGYVTAMPNAERSGGDTLRRSSAGRPLPGVELAIIDEAGMRLPPGGIGEVLIRSPAVMAGYFRNPQASAAAVDARGWLHTGDAGLLTEDGYLVLKDRLKDMIISGGENIYPAEIENVLSACPGVADVAVVGIPDERWGEVPIAFVVRRSAALEGAEVTAWARGQLASYKVPQRIEFIEALPRNASGKILHRDLRAPFWPSR